MEEVTTVTVTFVNAIFVKETFVQSNGIARHLSNLLKSYLEYRHIGKSGALSDYEF